MSKATILIVDDEAINIQLVAQILQNDYNLMIARSGKVALQLLNKELPDLILLDINMPEMSGFEVSKEIRNSSEMASKIPIIFLTANDSRETILEAFKLGAVDYIIKPFQAEELSVRVENHVKSYTLQKKLDEQFEKNMHLVQIVDKYVSFVKVNKKGIIQEISSDLSKNIQCNPNEIVGKNINILKSGNTPESLYGELWKTISANKTFTAEIENRNFKYGTNWYQMTISSSCQEDYNFDGYIAFYKNIDDKIKFKKYSETDKLTGLANRFKLDTILNVEIMRTNRYNIPLTVILVDIDFFKQVNDTYGHQVGDITLQEFATLLSTNIRGTDFIGRWGGEEFLIICPNITRQEAYILAQNLRKKIQLYHFSVIGHKTASFGVSQYKEQTVLKQLFEQADEALYTAKANGRNRVEIF